MRVASALAVLLALAAGFAQQAAAETNATAPLYWSSPVAVDPGHGFFGISCPTASLCVSVDYAGNVVTSTNPVAEDGAWSRAHVEGAALPMVDNQGGGVSCVSTPLCVAIVGSIGDIITSTNPTGGAGAWTLATIGHELEGISCASQSLCVAVGEKGEVLTATDPTGGAGAWTAAQIDGEYTIDGVSCPSTSFCVAVDQHGDVLTSTDPTGGAGAWTVTQLSTHALDNIACVASELCFAAGSYDAQSFVSTDPTGGPGSWTLTEGVDGSGGVSCAATTLCVAAHKDTNSGLSESADPAGGTDSWNSGEPGDVGARVVDGVSCPSVSLCLAVDAEGNVFVAAPAHRLSVSLNGSGTGGVESTPIPCPFKSCSHPGPHVIEPQPITVIECSDANSYLLPDNDCALGFPVGSEVTLTATPARGSMFDGWSGACTGTGDCTVDVSTERLVYATFGPLEPQPAIAHISSLRETHDIFTVARSSTALTGNAAAHRARGTVFSFALNQAATVKLAIIAARPGRRSGSICKQEDRALRHRPRCTRNVTVAVLTRVAGAGTSTIAFTGRIGHAALRPGRYRAVFTAVDQAGTSAPDALRFTIVAQ